jgi:curved DNA-binding protein CbpA
MPDKLVPNPYHALGVPSNAHISTIASVYRKKALALHPDKNPDNLETATKKFQELSESFAILKDPRRRDHYDKNGCDCGPRDEEPSKKPTSEKSEKPDDELFREFHKGNLGAFLRALDRYKKVSTIETILHINAFELLFISEIIDRSSWELERAAKTKPGAGVRRDVMASGRSDANTSNDIAGDACNTALEPAASYEAFLACLSRAGVSLERYLKVFGARTLDEVCQEYMEGLSFCEAFDAQCIRMSKTEKASLYRQGRERIEKKSKEKREASNSPEQTTGRDDNAAQSRSLVVHGASGEAGATKSNVRHDTLTFGCSDATASSAVAVDNFKTEMEVAPRQEPAVFLCLQLEDNHAGAEALRKRCARFIKDTHAGSPHSSVRLGFNNYAEHQALMDIIYAGCKYRHTTSALMTLSGFSILGEICEENLDPENMILVCTGSTVPKGTAMLSYLGATVIKANNNLEELDCSLALAKQHLGIKPEVGKFMQALGFVRRHLGLTQQSDAAEHAPNLALPSSSEAPPLAIGSAPSSSVAEQALGAPGATTSPQVAEQQAPPGHEQGQAPVAPDVTPANNNIALAFILAIADAFCALARAIGAIIQALKDLLTCTPKGTVDTAQHEQALASAVPQPGS